MKKKILSRLASVADNLEEMNLTKEANVVTKIMYRVAFGEGGSNVVVGPYDNPPWEERPEDLEAADENDRAMTSVSQEMKHILMGFCHRVLSLKPRGQSVVDFGEDWAVGKYDEIISKLEEATIKQLSSAMPSDQKWRANYLLGDVESGLTDWVSKGKDVGEEISKILKEQVADFV